MFKADLVCLGTFSSIHESATTGRSRRSKYFPRPDVLSLPDRYLPGATAVRFSTLAHTCFQISLKPNMDLVTKYTDAFGPSAFDPEHDILQEYIIELHQVIWIRLVAKVSCLADMMAVRCCGLQEATEEEGTGIAIIIYLMRNRGPPWVLFHPLYYISSR